MHPTALKNHFHDLRPAMLETIQNLVERESPSMEKPMLDDLARYLQGRFQDAGAEVDLLPKSTHGDHLRAFFPGPKNTASRPALILGHFDTVWPAGTLANRPLSVPRVTASRPVTSGSVQLPGVQVWSWVTWPSGRMAINESGSAGSDSSST